MNMKERMLSMPENKDADLNKIKELIEIMKENDLIEVEIIDGENKICLKRPNSAQTVVAAAAPMTAPVAAPDAPQDTPPTEADDGLIVFDTGDTAKDGEKLLKAIRTFSDKPVKAIAPRLAKSA